MLRLAHALWYDEAGVVISAELVLVVTILVIGTIVGLGEVQFAVVQELNDVGDAISSINQSFFQGGFRARGNVGNRRFKAFTEGASFRDFVDICDNNQGDLTCDMAPGERARF